MIRAERFVSSLPAALRMARRLVVLVVGAGILAFGLALIVLPGPAVVVIPAGLAILATEYLWARRLLRQLKARALEVFGNPTTGPQALTRGLPHSGRGAQP